MNEKTISSAHAHMHRLIIPNHKKIKTKLIVLLLSLIAFAGLTIGIIFVRHFYITTKQNIAADLQTIADDGALLVNEKINTTKTALEILSRLPELRDPNLHPREKPRLSIGSFNITNHFSGSLLHRRTVPVFVRRGRVMMRQIPNGLEQL